MRIGFVTFKNYHQRKEIGSSKIRAEWIIPYIKGAEEFVQGQKYDVVVFQKVYWKEYIRNFNGVKILDICDPDYYDGIEVVDLLNKVDGIIVSSRNLYNEIKQFTKTKVFYVPDGVNLKELPSPKKHYKKAKSVVWFGYSHNMELLDQTLFKIKNAGLLLRIVSDGNYNTGIIRVKNVKWDENCYKEIQKADFSIFPSSKKGRFFYKSNNKDVLSWALGLPVAKNPNDLEKFLDPKERQKEADKRYKEVKEKYDTRVIAKQYEKIIDSLIKNVKIKSE